MSKLNYEKLAVLSKKCRYDIVRMITSAGSGHIGGALSSIDIYLLLLETMDSNDRIVVSHGHSAAAVYSALGNMGYFDIEHAVELFRKEAPFEGHPSVSVNGVEWCSGALGQGLSVGCGFALAKKLKGEDGRIFVVMGDGEQQKGQLQEAREFAVRHKLDNLVAVIDYNGLQASGKISDINGQSLEDKYAMSGWKTVTADGHSFESLNKALSPAEKPLCVLAETVMGKGIYEIEDNYKYHGTVLDNETSAEYLKKFKLSAKEEQQLPESCSKEQRIYDTPLIPIKPGRVYQGGETDIRSALGNALADIAVENPEVHIAAFDCDLEGSVKLSEFKKKRPDSFIECGIAEENATSAAAAMAKSGVIAIHADFSLFNIAETYSQLRMADINKSPIKLFCTHAGLDVGEDGKTHQCIDYVSLLSNIYGMKIIVPADANQADCAVRYAMSVDSAVAIIGGRSKMPVLSDKNGAALGFEYGKADYMCEGNDGVIITYGNVVHRAVNASKMLSADGVKIGVLNIPTPAETDREAVLKAAETGLIITYEDHNIKTGISGTIAKILCESGVRCKFICMGVSKYGSSMPPEKLYKEQGLDEESLKNIILKSLNKGE